MAAANFDIKGKALVILVTQIMNLNINKLTWELIDCICLGADSEKNKSQINNPNKRAKLN